MCTHPLENYTLHRQTPPVFLNALFNKNDGDDDGNSNSNKNDNNSSSSSNIDIFFFLFFSMMEWYKYKCHVMSCLSYISVAPCLLLFVVVCLLSHQH